MIEYTRCVFCCGLCGIRLPDILAYGAHMVGVEGCTMVLLQCPDLQNLLLPR